MEEAAERIERCQRRHWTRYWILSGTAYPPAIRQRIQAWFAMRDKYLAEQYMLAIDDVQLPPR